MSRTVLLLDDDTQFRTSVTPALEAMGLRVVAASKGSVARALVDEDEPSLLVVDGLLPDTNGIAWIEELREAGFSTPVVFVSAFYRDLATFKHLTHDLDVLKVFHKPVVVDRFAKEIASTVNAPVAPAPPPPVAANDTEERVLFPGEPAVKPDLTKLKESFKSILPTAADSLTAVVHQVHAEADRSSLVAEALRQAHELHGTADSYGFGQVSDAAADIESQLRKLQISGRVDWPSIYKMIEEVRTGAAAAVGKAPEPFRPSATFPPPVSPAAAFLLHRFVPRDFVPTLLVLEDDPAMIAYLRSAFDEMLVHLRTAATVDEALRAAGAAPPTAVLVGWPLREREGLARFVQLFRGLRGCAEAPIVLLSVDEDANTRAFAAELGVDVFLPHPIELVRLHHAVETAIERASVPQAKIAVLRDRNAASVLEEAGIHCLLYFSLDELLREVDVQQPDAVILGSLVDDPRIPRVLRMSAWDSEFSLLCFTDSPLVKHSAIDERLDQEGGWVVEVHRRAERIARSRSQRFRCGQTGLLMRRGAIAGLESGLSSAQRHGRTYSIGLLRCTGLDAVDPAKACRLRTYLGRLIAGRFRREDVRGRWDEDTFTVGFDGSSARAVVDVVKRLMEEIAAQKTREQGELADLRVSLGLAAYPLDGDTTRALILTAQGRLDSAIEQGEGALVWR